MPSNSTSMNISFCIPAYRFDTFKNSFLSIVNLKKLRETNYEIVISDDSQNDNIKKYISKFNNKRIRYFRNKKKGSYENHNNLFRKANLTWILLLHDDDILYPNYLLELKKKWDIAQTADIVWAGKDIVDSENALIKTLITNGHDHTLMNAIDYLNFRLGNIKMQNLDAITVDPMITGLFFKKSLIRKSKAILDQDIGLGADMFFIYTLLLSSKKILYLNKPLSTYFYNITSERTEASYDGKVFYKSKYIIFKILESMKRKNKSNYDRYKKSFISFFYINNMRINGPILWTSLRFIGGYLKRIKVQSKIAYEILSNEPILLFNPYTYGILIVSLFPQALLRYMHKLFLKYMI